MTAVMAAMLTTLLPDASAQARPFEMGLIYWPPLGERTPEAIIRAGVGRTVESAEHIVVQLPWRPQGPDLPAMAAWMSGVAREHGKRLTIAVDWQDPARTGLLEARARPWSWREPAARDAFLDALETTARVHRPDVFVLGVEVNYHAHHDPASFADFVALLGEAGRRVRSASVGTRIAATLQYEFMTGRDRHWQRPADPRPVEALRDHLDVLGIATYPHLAGVEPADLDAAYFEPATRLGLPIAIYETAWPSVEPGSTDDQATYAQHLLAAAASIDATLVVWTSTTDALQLPEPDADRAAFDAAARWMRRLGLFTIDGEPKPAAAAWRSWLDRPRR